MGRQNRFTMNMERVKIVLIGAGSREFARGMIYDLVLDKELERQFQIHVVLVDIQKQNLEHTLKYAQRCATYKHSSVTFSATTDRVQALQGANFVLLSIAVKRTELWEQDFRVPLAFGLPHIYGENGGPGSIFHSLRNLHMILPICQDIERYCPDAWLINFTNPEAKNLTAILNLTNVKALGLCHGFYSFQRFASIILERPIDVLDVRTAGINHFFTYYKIDDAVTGDDLIPMFKTKLGDRLEELPPLVRYLYEKFGAIGYISDEHIGEYLGFAHEIVGNLWTFGIEKRTIKQNEAKIDTRTIFEAWRKNLDVHTYLEQARNDIHSSDAGMLSDDEIPDDTVIQKSGELAIPVIGDILLNRKELRRAVNVLNSDGYIENLDRDTSIEVPAWIDSSGIHPDHVGRLPDGFAALIKQQQAVQRLLVEALRSSSKQVLLQAFLLDPISESKAVETEKMLDYMLKLQKEYLPEFV